MYQFYYTDFSLPFNRVYQEIHIHDILLQVSATFTAFDSSICFLCFRVMFVFKVYLLYGILI